jgi:hypothetical protein
VDLDAEMAELAREARRRLDDQAEREARERGADGIVPRVDPELALPSLDVPSLDLGDLEASPEAAGVSLGTQVVLCIVGLVAFAVLWKTVLGSVVQALISLALLALILLGIAKLLGRGGEDADSE